MFKLNLVGWIAMILVIVGAINWGLVGLFGMNLVAMLFGSVPMLEKVVYIAVGVAGIYVAYVAYRLS